MAFAIFVSLANLIFYCVQQLGVTLGVGAETVLLVAYLQSIRDGVIDDHEKGFARAVRRVKDFALIFVVTSGLGIVAVEFIAGQLYDFISVIVLFKWSLILVVLFLAFLTRGITLTSGLLLGLSAGTWYALFAVHILAPTASWFDLGIFYAIWLVGFSVCWTIAVFAFRDSKSPAALQSKSPPPAKKPVPSKPAAPAEDRLMRQKPPQPAPSTPQIPPQPIPSVAPQASMARTTPMAAVPPAPKPASAPPPPNVPTEISNTDISPLWLHVMPRNPEDLTKQQSKEE